MGHPIHSQPSQEYPIRALVRVGSCSWPECGLGDGSVIWVKSASAGRYESPDKDNPKRPFPWFANELILNPSDAQIAEERAKAGLPAEPSEGGKDLEPVREDAHRAPTVPEVLRASARNRETPAGFRRLEVGEVLVLGDQVWPAKMTTAEGMRDTICTDQTMEAEDVGFYYRPIPGAAEGEALPEAPAEGSPSLPSAPAVPMGGVDLDAIEARVEAPNYWLIEAMKHVGQLIAEVRSLRAALSKLEGGPHA